MMRSESMVAKSGSRSEPRYSQLSVCSAEEAQWCPHCPLNLQPQLLPSFPSLSRHLPTHPACALARPLVRGSSLALVLAGSSYSSPIFSSSSHGCYTAPLDSFISCNSPTPSSLFQVLPPEGKLYEGGDPNVVSICIVTQHPGQRGVDTSCSVNIC